MWAADALVCRLVAHSNSTDYISIMPIRKKLQLSGPALAFITTTAKDWLPVFNNKKVAQIVLLKLAELTKRYNISVVGYALMPSHLHMLLGFKAFERMSEFMKSFKSLSSREIKNIYDGRFIDMLYSGDKFNLWKPRYDDLIIVSQEQFKIKLDYIHNNPVKGDLVANPKDWPYSSAIDWVGGKNEFLEIDKNFGWLK